VALHDGLVPDEIIDANHTIQYLKYVATRRLLTKRGKEKETDDRLSAVRVSPSAPYYRDSQSDISNDQNYLVFQRSTFCQDLNLDIQMGGQDTKCKPGSTNFHDPV
jgi:hypothetical protein